MAKIVGHHQDGSACYTVGCRLGHLTSKQAAFKQGDVSAFLDAATREDAASRKAEALNFLSQTPRNILLRNHYTVHGFNTSTADKLSIVETPVSDREANYYIDIQKDGWVELDINETGIYDPEYGVQGEYDRLYIGNKNGAISLQYATDGEDLSYVVEDMSDTERQKVEENIRSYVKTNYNADVDFTSSSNWDHVSLLFNSEQQTGYERLENGAASVTTSNIMGSLESDKDYVKVRGTGSIAVYEAMNALNVSY